MKKHELMKKLGSFNSVENYKGMPSQFLIYFENGYIFQSYKSIIAIKAIGKTYIGEDFDYSVTTGKYRNIFLCETLKETRVKIKSGEYEMIED